MKLEELRDKIDEADARIVRLIAERIKFAQEIGQRKREAGKPIQDQEREKVVFEHVRSIAREAGIGEEEVQNIYRQIVAACKKVQGIEVAFQGEVGAYSEEAAFHFFGATVSTRPRESLEDVFKFIQQGVVPFGIVPVENSLGGSITQTYDLLLNSNLMVMGEMELKVIHCLIANPGVRLDSIRKVYSHPQALAQCQAFLKHLGFELIPTYDTAGSVKLIKEREIIDGAAIAGARAAEFYGMRVIAREIEDNPNNFTRFFVLAKQDSPPSGNDKTSIVFSLKSRPGALYEALKEFAVRHINLTKIESRPTKQTPWEYNFYLDFEGHREEPAVKEALENLDRISLFVKVLGSYPKAK